MLEAEVIQNTKEVKEQIECKHCKDVCADVILNENGDPFCCSGCEMAYQLLSENGLLDFYSLNEVSGKKVTNFSSDRFEYLEDEGVIENLVKSVGPNLKEVVFTLPQIHCSSCLFLLEKLPRLHTGIHSSRVNFFQKSATILFNDLEISLKQLVILLSRIGYAPQLSYKELNEKTQSNQDKSLYYKLGIAGFSFGNIMLLSFPEYLGFRNAGLYFYISYINIFLAIPVVFYGGWDYISSAFKGLRNKHLNIDLPIAMGILALFGRSLFEIVSQSGEGYLDSLTGFIFFLLIGKWYQNITYRSIDFERNYKSYFPISVLIQEDNQFISRSLKQLQVGDLIRIRSGEIIPADGTIVEGKARIDYSFVSGESECFSMEVGEEVYAGGRQTEASIIVKTTKSVDQSYLTKLWDHDAFGASKTSQSEQLMASISKFFTLIVIALALSTLMYWWFTVPQEAFRVFTTVLIVACPCALALSIPFSYGNLLRIFSGQQFFIKNTNVIESIQNVNHVVFDKTGTLTDTNSMQVSFKGKELSEKEVNLIYTACFQSGHPLSQQIVKYLKEYNPTPVSFNQYEEKISKGLIVKFDDAVLRLGSADFILDLSFDQQAGRAVHVEINEQYLGPFTIRQALRQNIEDLVELIVQDKNNRISLLSGDDDKDHELMRELLGEHAALHFRQSPIQKLKYIKSLQENGEKVMMIGDGLNDAGALKQSDVGIIVSDDQNNFVPACDAIIAGHQLENLGVFIKAIKHTRHIVFGLIFLSLCYNLFGLSYAINGLFTPVIAAILMPLSSVTIVIVGLLSTWLLALVYGLTDRKISN